MTYAELAIMVAKPVEVVRALLTSGAARAADWRRYDQDDFRYVLEHHARRRGNTWARDARRDA